VTGIKDSEVLPVMLQLINTNNNIARASSNTKAIWSQNVIENISSSAVPRTIIHIYAANYGKFNKKNNNLGNTQTFRKGF